MFYREVQLKIFFFNFFFRVLVRDVKKAKTHFGSMTKVALGLKVQPEI